MILALVEGVENNDIAAVDRILQYDAWVARTAM